MCLSKVQFQVSHSNRQELRRPAGLAALLFKICVFFYWTYSSMGVDWICGRCFFLEKLSISNGFCVLWNCFISGHFPSGQGMWKIEVNASAKYVHFVYLHSELYQKCLEKVFKLMLYLVSYEGRLSSHLRLYLFFHANIKGFFVIDVWASRMKIGIVEQGKGI